MANINYKAIFGRNLKYYRLRSGLTQELLAEKIGVTAQHLSYVESGKRAPSFDLMVSISLTLQIEPKDLLDGISTKSMKSTQTDLKIISFISGLSPSQKVKVFKILNLSF